MRMKRRVLGLIISLVMLISVIFPAALLAAPTSAPARTGGLDRYLTSVEVAKIGWPTGAENVVLVNAYSPVDGAVAVPYAYKLNAPVLLTDCANIPDATLNQLQNLKAKNITLIGSENVISKEVKVNLESLGYKVTRLGSSDRYATAAEVAKAFGKTNNAIVVNGDAYPDALTIASWAAVNSAPILYTPKDALPETTKNALTSIGAASAIVVGSETVVNKSVFDMLPTAKRYSGTDRYGTATQVASQLFTNPDTLFVATGLDFVDAAVGANLAAKNKAPLIYVDKTIPASVKDYLKTAKASVKNISLIGGTGAITNSQQIWLQSLISAETSATVTDAVANYFNNIPVVGDSYKISEADLKAALEKNPNGYLVIDIRKADAYAKGHIKGAVNLPYGPAIGDNLAKIRTAANGKTVVVACYTGQTAGQTDSLLNLAGIKTRSLNFGMGDAADMDQGKGWLKLNYPTVTDPSVLPDVVAVSSPNAAIDELVKKYFNPLPSDSYKMSSTALKSGLATSPEQFFVVDVRQAVDYNKGHVKGAINVPYGPDLAKNLTLLKEKSFGKTMVVYCYTGQTAGQVDSLMNLFGIPTKSLHYGYGTATFKHGWSGEGNESIDTLTESVATYFNNLPVVGDSYKISEVNLKTALETNPAAYVVLDIRQADAYAKGHIKGALNIPYGPGIAQNLDKIRAAANGKTLIVACYSGQTAGQTDTLLNLAGIKTRSLNFGMGDTADMDQGKGWLKLGYPVVTDPTAMPDAPAVTSPNTAIDDVVKKYFDPLPTDTYKIKSEALKPLLETQADKYLVVDVRQAADYSLGHVPGAINIPYGPDVAKNLTQLKQMSQGKTVIVYCYTGQTAGQVDSALNFLGIPTKSLHYGFGTATFKHGWSGLGYPTVK